MPRPWEAVLFYHVALSHLFRAAMWPRPSVSMSLASSNHSTQARALPSRRLSVAPMMDWT